MRISHSQKETYLTCGYKWKLHYQDRLRSTKIGSALFFGSAIDAGLNRLLLAKKKNLTEEEKSSLSKSALQTFKDAFRIVDINGKSHDVSSSLLVSYFNSDLDITLLSIKEIDELIKFADFLEIDFNCVNDIHYFIDECKLTFKAKKKLADQEQRLFNYMCWKSLIAKGTMLIQEYEHTILPKIHEVFEIQTKVKLEDGEDIFIGFIDVILSFKSAPNVKYVTDNKTSSKPYKEDSVRTSPQLAAYCEYAQLDKAAFIVVEKKIRKRHPKVRINIIKDDMPNQQIQDTFESVTNVIQDINEKKFDKNYDSCYAYGRKCAYYEYCRTGKIDKGLIHLPERNGSNGKIDGANKSTALGASEQIKIAVEENSSRKEVKK